MASVETAQPTAQPTATVHLSVVSKGQSYKEGTDSSMATREAMDKFRAQKSPIEKYLWLRQLCRDNYDLHFKLLLDHTEEILPFIYTPTVGEACRRYGELGIQTRGLYLRPNDRGHILEKLRQWPWQDIRVIVVTDGERILGLGDLGAGGMGISEGKITLYTAAAGVNPHQCLPVCLDVGTNNDVYLNDPSYPGLRQKRLSGDDYYSFVDEFFSAVREWRPHVLVQCEDFANHSAFDILDKYRDVQPVFNDDIQGTACVALAGLLAALRISGKSLGEQKILFHGAGEAGIGIGDLIALSISRNTGIPIHEARTRCIFMDSKGLICKERLNPSDPKLKLQEHKKSVAHDMPFIKDLATAVKELRPTALVGVSTQGGAFTPEILRLMAEINEHPIIFPLSNPTDLAECTFRDAVEHTDGRLAFASGSPFDPLDWHGQTLYLAQANNAYIFPAVGHAAILTQCKQIPDSIFLTAAEALAHLSSDDELKQGMLFPRFRDILKVSSRLIAEVAEEMVREGLGKEPEDFTGNWESYARSKMWYPSNNSKL